MSQKSAAMDAGILFALALIVTGVNQPTNPTFLKAGNTVRVGED